MSNDLGYTDVKLPEDAVFKISPSAFAKFIESPHIWYREQVLGEREFTHNTSTVIGTVVHYCAEMVAEGKPVDKRAIEEYVFSHAEHEEFDPNEVMAAYPAMAECLVNGYVLKNMNQYIGTEMQFVAPLGDGFYAGGTLDVLQGSKNDCMLVDYKTYSSKTKPKSIPRNYKYQLLVYAFMLMLNGYNVTRIRLVYVNRYVDGGLSEKTGKPLKSYPPEVTELTEVITEEDIEFIKSLLSLCKDTVIASNNHPELNHVIWHDWRLKS